MRTRSGGQYVARTGPIRLERATDPQVRESHESFRLSPSRKYRPAGTFQKPDAVGPRKLDAPAAGAKMTFKLPPRSYTVAQFGT